LIGCDLARPHMPAVVDFALEDTRPRSAYQGMAMQIRRWLAARFPGSSVHVDDAVLMLVRVPIGGSARDVWQGLRALQPALQQSLAVRVAGGIGGVCVAVGDYRHGFLEAREALRVARARGSDQEIAYFGELGAARYLSRIPRQPPGDEPRDRYQQCVERVASYDARKGTTLLGTLETYLASGGNIARAASRLFIHRNTVVQRLERLRDLLGFDPHESDHWLALQIAIQLRG
jgi:DNA-binding PucR family transcriptional regulator